MRIFSLCLFFVALLPPAVAAAPPPTKPAQMMAVVVTDNCKVLLRQFRLDAQGRAVQLTRTSLTPAGDRQYLGQAAISPDGRFVYVPVTGRNQINQYRLLADGSLSPLPIPFITVGPEAVRIQFAPRSRGAYVLCRDGIWQFRQRNDGQLIRLAATKVVSGQATEKHQLNKLISKSGDSTRVYEVEAGDTVTPLSLIFSADGRRAYVLNHEFYYKGREEANWGGSRGGGTYVDVSRWISDFQVAKDSSLIPDMTAPVTVDLKVTALSISPDSRVVSAVNAPDRIIYFCAVSSSGAVMPPVKVPVSGNAIAFGLTGREVYVSVNDTVRPYRIDESGWIAVAPAVTLPHAGEDMKHSISAVSMMQTDVTGHLLLAYYESEEDGYDIAAYTLLQDGCLSDAAQKRIPIGGYGTVQTWRALPPQTVAVRPEDKPRPVASVSHKVEYLYVLNENKTISQYAIANDGHLRPLTPPNVTIKSFTLPIWYSLVADASGHNVYLMNTQLTDRPGGWYNEISRFSVGPSGNLTQEPAAAKFSDGAYGDQPLDLLVDPIANVAYVTFAANKDKIQAFPINPDGTFTDAPAETVFSDSSGRRAMYMNPAARLLHIQDGMGKVVSYHLSSDGHLDPVSQSQPNLYGPLTFDPSGKAAFVGDGDNSVRQYQISADGSLVSNPQFDVPADQRVEMVAYGRAGSYAYAVNGGSFYGDGSISQYRIGAGSRLTPLRPAIAMTDTSPDFLGVDPTGHFLYTLDTHMHFPSALTREASNAINEYQIGADGTLTALGSVENTSVSKAVVIVQPRP